MAKSTKIKTEYSESYRLLLSDLADILETGRHQAKQAVNRELLHTYWKLGARLSDSDRSQQTMSQLARDLSLPRILLYNTQKLYSRYPDGPPTQELSWSHHRRLLWVNDSVERAKYEKAAVKEAWTVRKLDTEIKRGRFQSKAAKQKRSADLPARPTASTYLYNATFVRAVDGDTVILSVDLGFYVRLEQRMRLAKIDAPELGTSAGDKAHQFVVDALSASQSIAVQTHRVDRYGRYIAHIFYSDQPDMLATDLVTNGTYLNQTLVSHGHARRT